MFPTRPRGDHFFNVNGVALGRQRPLDPGAKSGDDDLVAIFRAS